MDDDAPLPFEGNSSHWTIVERHTQLRPGTDAKLQTILAVAQALQKAQYPIGQAREQFSNLRVQAIAADRDATKYIPRLTLAESEADYSLRSELSLALNQMIAYLNARVAIVSGKDEASSMLWSVNVILMLESYGLTIRWAISAAALSLIEVMANRKLTDLRLETTGEFDKRLSRLANALKAKGIEIPELLVSGLYKVRSKVIHEGRQPTSEEMKTIFEILTSLHEKIR